MIIFCNELQGISIVVALLLLHFHFFHFDQNFSIFLLEMKTLTF